MQISHGSFASVYQTRGKEALELQLERFFTVWAWSWDLEGQTNFREYFGTLLDQTIGFLSLTVI